MQIQQKSRENEGVFKVWIVEEVTSENCNSE